MDGMLGDYEIIKQIGQGALGTVFLAEHRFIKKQFMLKVLPEELVSDRAFVQRFQADVGLLAALEHPHIVKVHQVSFSQGLYFLVSDCIVDEVGETTNLGQYLLSRGKGLQEEEAFSILHQVAEALDYAHARKRGDRPFAHRGLKLNNILVGRAKSPIDVSLCDFGLSAIVGEAAILTRTYRVVAENLGLGALVNVRGEGDKYAVSAESSKVACLHQSFLQGFAFLAPEQKRIEREPLVDYKADAYAFGVLAYYLLTNQWPEGIFDFPNELHPELRRDWNGLIRGCLRGDPARRPELLVDALDSLSLEKGMASQVLVKMRDEATPSEGIEETSQAVLAGPTAEILPQPVLSIPVGVEAEAHAPRPVLSHSILVRPEVDLDPGAALQVESGVKHYEPEKREQREVRPLLSEMKTIPGGAFLRGSSEGARDETPAHKIFLLPFALDIHPVTNDQFVRFLEVMGGEKDHQHQDLIILKESRIKRFAGKLSVESGYAKHPVVGVTWYGAVAYAKWVGKRLPTEAEWEVAARGGQESIRYPTGNEVEKSQANFFSSDTTPVMSYVPNGYGLYDMAGNVYEWCHDWYGYNYYEMSMQEPENPRGPLQGVYRVLRGGCWKSVKEDLRCAKRHRNNPGTVNSTYGFRCAANVR